MLLFRLSEDQVEPLKKIPEAAMGVHVCRVAGRKLPALVIGGQVVALYRANDDNEMNSKASEKVDRHLKESWLETGQDWKQREEAFGSWLDGLGPFPFRVELIPARLNKEEGESVEKHLQRLTQQMSEPINVVHAIEEQRAAYGMYIQISTIPFPQPPPPATPPIVYGHVPFPAVTERGDVFYRYEAFPVSQRIDRKNETIATGTFVSPQSEVAFMPTGFSAVARCALPNVLPACFRWELQPDPGAPARCGAAVPQFGQSGGGVEVVFTTLTRHSSPIPNPAVIPPL